MGLDATMCSTSGLPRTTMKTEEKKRVMKKKRRKKKLPWTSRRQAACLSDGRQMSVDSLLLTVLLTWDVPCANQFISASKLMVLCGDIGMDGGREDFRPLAAPEVFVVAVDVCVWGLSQRAKNSVRRQKRKEKQMGISADGYMNPRTLHSTSRGCTSSLYTY